MAEITLRQIAERVGCTVATVSYALRNSPNVSQTKRDLIRQVADELGWKPDAALAKQMALVRSSSERANKPKLAIVINKTREDLKLEKAQRMQLDGALDYAEKKGFIVDVFSLAEEPLRPARLKSILEARGVEGIVYIATMDPKISKEHLEAGEGFACCVCGIRYPDTAYHVVVPDHLAGGRLVIEHLLKQGYRRPAVVVPRGVDEPLGYAYAGGLASGMVLLDEKNQLRVQYGGRDENHIPEYDFERISNWLSHNKPDAVLSTDLYAMGKIVPALPKPLNRLPLFSLDWFEGQTVRGGLNQSHEHIGAAAVDLVVAQIHRGEKGLPKIQRALNIEGEWRDCPQLQTSKASV